MESNTAINCCDEQKREAEEEEEEEALSLCDLPVNLIEEENRLVQQEENGEPETISKSEEDFNFGSWSDPLSIKPEMCSADELFFKGQILPLRLSVSSDTSRCFSRSESMDHGSLSRFTSVGSSSTISSHYTTSSSGGNSKAAIKIRNNFNTHPSPKPQIRTTKTRTPNIGIRNQRTSSVWDFFRLGLVRAPELELQDLKLRSSSNNKNNDNKNSVSRNSSCNSSNSSSSTKVVNNGGGEAAKNQRDLSKGLLEKRLGLLFGGCKCSVNAVETVPSNNIVVAKSSSSINNKNSSEKEKATSSHARSAIEEKKKKKQALSRHRTFEWIKELSHASYVDDA